MGGTVAPTGLIARFPSKSPGTVQYRPMRSVRGQIVFAPIQPLMAHSAGAQRAAIYLRVPANGARGLAAFAEPRGPLPDSGLVSGVRPDIG